MASSVLPVSRRDSPFCTELVAAAITGGRITLGGAPCDHLGAFLETLGRIGVGVSCGTDTIEVDGEVAEVRWLPLTDAPRLLAYSGEREMAEQIAAVAPPQRLELGGLLALRLHGELSLWVRVVEA